MEQSEDRTHYNGYVMVKYFAYHCSTAGAILTYFSLEWYYISMFWFMIIKMISPAAFLCHGCLTLLKRFSFK